MIPVRRNTERQMTSLDDDDDYTECGYNSLDNYHQGPGPKRLVMIAACVLIGAVIGIICLSIHLNQ